MVKKVLVFFIIYFFCVTINGFIWVYDFVIRDESDIEKLYSEGHIDFISYIDLLDIFKNKVDLNRATYNELMEIPYINQNTAKKIIKNRNYISVRDIMKIKTVDKYLYKRIKHFLKVEMKDKFENTIYIYKNEDYQYIKNKTKFSNLYCDLKFVYEQKINYISANKYIFEEEKYKFEVNSYFLKYQISKNFEIAGGNYRLKFGEGLLLSDGSSYGRNNYKSDMSSSEYLKGVIVKKNIGNIDSYLFYSGMKKDRSVYLYYEEEERYRKKNLDDIYWEELKGIGVTYNFNQDYIGFSYIDYFDNLDETPELKNYGSLFYGLDLYDIYYISGEITFSNSKIVAENRFSADFSNNYFDISYFTNSSGLYLPFVFDYKNESSNIFVVRHRYNKEKIGIYSKLNYKNYNLEDNSIFYSKVNYEFSDRIDFNYKYYCNDDSYYNQIGVEFTKDRFEIGSFFKKKSDNDLGLKVFCGYKIKKINIDFLVNYSGNVEEEWDKYVKLSLSWKPLSKTYMSLYLKNNWEGTSSNFDYRFYLRKSI